VYVYRDTSDQADDPGPAASRPAEQDASYWYDLPGTGSGGDASQVIEETRGPFEPLVSSTDPPGTAPRPAAGLDAAGVGRDSAGRDSAGRDSAGRDSAGPDSAGPDSAGPDSAGPAETPGAPDDENQDTAHARARKLEQIKDLYLTAEAIGEANVDKHFDQLLAQQRELISDYFKQSSTAGPAAGEADRAQSEPGGSGDAGGPAGAARSAPEGARVAADQPRVW
jgi:hypothetical protein